VGVTTHAPGLGSLPRYLLGMYTVVCTSAPAHQRTTGANEDAPGQMHMHVGRNPSGHLALGVL
jgi:hypothetical protein